MVLVEIATSLTGIKTALDILKGLKKSDTSRPILGEIADLQSALIEVQQGIMAANETHTADIERIRDLEKEVADLKAWGAERENYELINVGFGSVVYSLKQSIQPRGTPHWLCANCYTQGKKSFLSRVAQLPIHGAVNWACSNCPTKVSVSIGVAPQ